MKITSIADMARAVSTIRAATQDDNLTLEMYGDIGASWFGDGTTAQDVADALKGSHSTVTVRLNSPGGNCFEGIAIYNLLKSSGKRISVIIDGLAASAASIIAMAGDTIEMGTGTMMMVHPAQTVAAGSAEDMLKTAEILTKATASMAAIYAAKTGKTLEELITMMAAETWMTPEEAMDNGFATQITTNPGDVMTTAKAYNLAAVYANTPVTLRVFGSPEPAAPTFPVAALALRALNDLHG